MTDPSPRLHPAGRIVPAADVRTIRDADAYLAAARAARDGIEAELDALRKAARDEAAAEGAADAAVAASRALARAEAEGAARLDALEGEMGTVVAQIVTRIIGETPSDDTIRAATRTALDQLRDHRASVIRVAADIAAPVEAAVAEVAAKAKTDPIRVEIDSRFEPGRCVFSSDKGYVEIGLPALLGAALKPFTEPDNEPG